MDEQRFDQLSRRLAGFRTRRQVLKALAGAVVGGVAATRSAAAQSCTPHYSPCRRDGDCCGGSVCQWGICMPGCRIDGEFQNAWMSPGGDICQICTPELSTTSWSPANEGMSCWSGDPNAGFTTCRSGVCAGAGAVDCRPHTVCNTAAVNPATGQCEQGFAPAGTACGNPAICNGEFFQPADACDGNGFCVGGGSQSSSCAPYRCGQGACTSSCSGDADCASNAHCDAGQCIGDLNLGQSCDEDSDCQSGICSDGVCCNRRCDGLCVTCSAATGGYCAPVVCEQGPTCTTTTCDPERGCISTPRARGASCADGNRCNGDEACDGAGNCVAGIPVVCDPCTSCDPASGVCQADATQDGASCPGDGNQCFGEFICDAGSCVGADPVVCTAPDSCHQPGACDPSTGICSPPVPTTDVDSDPLNCGACGNACGAGANCDQGTCTCPPFTTQSGNACVDPCSVEGACDGCRYCNANAAGEAVCSWNYAYICGETCDTDADCPGAYPSCLAWPGKCSNGLTHCSSIRDICTSS